MSTWKSHGLRGSVLEEQINDTNFVYRNSGLALVQKIPTPITPVQLNGHGQISLAFFGEKSTVDYIGAVQGVPVCFDAKESKTTTFPLANIHQHQVDFMRDFREQGGVAFFLLNFTSEGDDVFYFLSIDELDKYWARAEAGGRKSFRFDELDQAWFLPKHKSVMVPYLEGVKKYLEEKDKKERENGNI